MILSIFFTNFNLFTFDTSTFLTAQNCTATSAWWHIDFIYFSFTFLFFQYLAQKSRQRDGYTNLNIWLQISIHVIYEL